MGGHPCPKDIFFHFWPKFNDSKQHPISGHILIDQSLTYKIFWHCKVLMFSEKSRELPNVNESLPCMKNGVRC